MTTCSAERKLTTALMSCLLCVWVMGCLSLAPGRDVDTIRPAASLPETTPWDLKALSAPPDFKWLDKEGEIRSLLYQGEPFGGKQTSVFAYYATPDTLAGKDAASKPFPAVVLVHGGGGTAFDEWVRLWAKRGYAAIAMDLAGCGAERKRLPDGGPDQGDDTKFGQIDSPVTEQWTYHAVANVIRAHSLIRSFDEVDKNRTAVTGISWGGYLTCIVAGLDDRFKAAVPVYGCGFLHENSVWLPQFEQMTADQRQKWVQLWDPSSYVGSAAMPVFFINGTNDFAYWLESYAKTYGLVNSERNTCITVRMPHGHEAGWAPKEIGLFVDQYLVNGSPLPEMGTPEMAGGEVRARVRTRTALKSAALHYTTDTTPNSERNWQTVPATIDGKTIRVQAPPPNAGIWFLTAQDKRRAIVSTELVFAEK